MPPVYLDSRIKRGLTTKGQDRRQAEWDDHGEAYPFELAGPDLYCNLDIPDGQHILSFYDLNKDAHEGSNRYRDYLISIRIQPERHGPDDNSDFDRQPELARARIRDFWGGVYKRFLVRGPISLKIRFSRNHSLNTIMDGVMLDTTDERPSPYFPSPDDWERSRKPKAQETRADIERLKRLRQASLVASASAMDIARALLAELEEMQTLNPSWWAANDRIDATLMARLAAANIATQFPRDKLSLKASSFYQAGLYPQWEECLAALDEIPARQVEKSLTWDGVTAVYSGRGHQTVIEYLHGKANVRVGGSSVAATP